MLSGNFPTGIATAFNNPLISKVERKRNRYKIAEVKGFMAKLPAKQLKGPVGAKLQNATFVLVGANCSDVTNHALEQLCKPM